MSQHVWEDPGMVGALKQEVLTALEALSIPCSQCLYFPPSL